MRSACRAAAGVVAVAGAITQAPLAAQGPPAVTAFVDVNVLTPGDPAVLTHRVVIVEGGRIARIGGLSDPIPGGAHRVEGHGTRWLMPGLVDMHVHALERGELVTYLANGVTTIRNLHGVARQLAWRDSLSHGQMVGPRLVTAGPIIDGDPPTRSTNVVVRTAEDARQEVARQAALGFEWIKVYDHISPEAYAAVVAAARERGLPVAGHLPTPVGLSGVLASPMQTLEHVEELLPLFDDGRSAAGVDSVARALAAAGIAVVPNLIVYRSALDQVNDWAALQARAELAHLNPETAERWGWEQTGSGRSGNARGRERWARTTTFFTTTLVPALHRAGVVLLAGSDAPIPVIVPGYGFHDELALLQGAGLSPEEVLGAATVNAAVVLGVQDRRGAVRVGHDADLLLLESDPRQGVEALRRRVGVMVAGRWLDQGDLDRMVPTYR